MVMRKRLDCERMGGEGIPAGMGGEWGFWEGDCGCLEHRTAFISC